MIEWLSSTSFSLLEGVLNPEELLRQASKKGYLGLGVADRMNMYSWVRAFRTQRELEQEGEAFFFAPGLRLHFDQADPLFIFPLNKPAHGRLCEFLSNWALAGSDLGEKGLSPLPWREFFSFLSQEECLFQDFVLVVVSGRFYPWPKLRPQESTRLLSADIEKQAASYSVEPMIRGQVPFWLLELIRCCGRGIDSALSLAYPLLHLPGAEDLRLWLEELSQKTQIPLLATTLPLFGKRHEQELCDLLHSIRFRIPIENLGYRQQANADRCLLGPLEIKRWKGALKRRKLFNDPFARGEELSERHKFSLFDLKYRYPREAIPTKESSSDYLRRLAYEGGQDRYPEGMPAKVLEQLERELSLVKKLRYEDYFLTMWDILKYARKKEILFQGRGSAANSILCYVLKITAVDPVRMNLLFERFISEERREAPDIDVDFEHERREEVIQEVYRRYGRRRAAMLCTVICFRSRMAFRETAKAFGLKEELISEFSSFMGREGLKRLEEDAPFLKNLLKKHRLSRLRWEKIRYLSRALVGLPRNIGLHTGGFVLADEELTRQCLIEPARKEDRSVICWDKDNVDYLGWMKVDLLSLGMLTVIRKALHSVSGEKKNPIDLLAALPAECPKVYRALEKADTVGVFQIESRAQMNMLPRFRPKNFYDIVIEVAIVRPGPLQGGMVHPYLRRRQGLEPVLYDHPALVPILKKTLGVPIFQEQVMKIAVAIGNFSAGEADRLRKVMSGAWRGRSNIRQLKETLIQRMRRKKIPEDLCQRIYRQIEGFGEYGFPESHAASFALLTYASAWLKVHHPSEFLCALLNSQPMGFYSPRSLIADATRHGVRVKPVSLVDSRWESHLVENPYKKNTPYVQLGFSRVPGFSEQEAQSIQDLQKKGILSAEHEDLPGFEKLFQAGLERKTLKKLIQARAFFPEETQEKRRSQIWSLQALRGQSRESPPLPFLKEDPFEGRERDRWEALLEDYRKQGRSDLGHPVSYARSHFFPLQADWKNSQEIIRSPAGRRVAFVGSLSVKQKPPTAGGICFITLEDEHGFINLVLMPQIYERDRLILEFSWMLAGTGFVERSHSLNQGEPEKSAVSLKVERLWNPFEVQDHRIADKEAWLPRDLRPVEAKAKKILDLSKPQNEKIAAENASRKGLSERGMRPERRQVRSWH